MLHSSWQSHRRESSDKLTISPAQEQAIGERRNGWKLHEPTQLSKLLLWRKHGKRDRWNAWGTRRADLVCRQLALDVRADVKVKQLDPAGEPTSYAREPS